MLKTTIVAAALLIPSLTYASGFPQVPGHRIVDTLAHPARSAPHVASPASPVPAERLAAMRPANAVTSFPYEWNGQTATHGNVCTGGPVCEYSVAFGCFNPPFAATPFNNNPTNNRACDNAIRGTGQFFAQNASGDDQGDGEEAVGFPVVAPNWTPPPSLFPPVLEGYLSADTIYQYEYQLGSNFPFETSCSSRLSLYVQDVTAGSTVMETDWYPYTASEDGPGYFQAQTTGSTWYALNSGMSAGFAATPGHEYAVWVWAQVNNDDHWDHDQISVWVRSVSVNWIWVP